MVRFGQKVVVTVTMMLGLTLLSSNAAAESMTFAGLNLSQRVTVGGTNPNNIKGTIWAGELTWQWVGDAPEGFAQLFYAYCVDLANFVTSPQQVAEIRSTNGFTNGVASGGSKAAWLFTEYAGAVHNTRDALGSAALQLAIWEAMYDTTNNLSGGAFNAIGTDSAITDRANEYLTTLYRNEWTSVATILNSNLSTGGQDQITRVNEPSTLLFLGLAFFGIAALARRSSGRTA